MLSVGFDIGSSSIKCAIIDTDKNAIIAGGFYPRDEMKISSLKSGWAEQDPNVWWENAKILFTQLTSENKIDKSAIKSIGISYQMHGLVLVDKDGQVIRPSIIWCDSRAVEIGNKAFDALGHNYC
ncbi:MAG TPA: FGGY family carbohydrate kinase, partial [Ignavibacteriales bacterium]|nr:FGGY family carbohydrate kinase [Ignavibacteriales bacterium]